SEPDCSGDHRGQHLRLPGVAGIPVSGDRFWGASRCLCSSRRRVNLLPGFRKELVPTFATHTHIRGVNAVVSQEEKKQLQLGAAESIKRVRARKRDGEFDWTDGQSQRVYEIRDFIE